MSLRFFSRSKTVTHVPPPGIAPPLQSKPVVRSPLDTPASTAPAAEVDTLSVFLPEEAPATAPRARAQTAEGRQAPSRNAPAVDARDPRASLMEMKRLDDFRRLMAQTQALLERLKGDSTALRTDLSELRSLGDHLGQGYSRLGDICRLTEKRSQLTVDVLNGIEKRIEPLEAVRDLTASAEDGFASLKQLADEIKHSQASFETQMEAIGQGREEATRVGRALEELQLRVASMTEKSEWLGEAEATVGRLEHRAVETTSKLDRRIEDFDLQKQTVERALAEAARVTAILNALERRIAALTGGDQGVGYAEDTIGQLERRAAQTTAELEWRVGNLDEQRQTIEQAAIEATRVTTILSALEARVSALTGGEQGLGHAERTVAHLEQRATATMAELERRLGGFDERKRSLEQALDAACTKSGETLGQADETVGWLEQRVAETTAQFERRVTHFESQKQAIEEAMLAALAEGDRRLGHASETLCRLEHRGAETAAQLERRVSDADARRQSIEQALAATTVALERRTADATASLEQAVRVRNDVERELERLGRQLQTLTESARNSITEQRSATPSTVSRWNIRRPLLRWAPILAVLIAVELSIVTLLLPSGGEVAQPLPPPLARNSGELRGDLAEARSAKAGRAAKIATTAPASLPLPSTASGLAMYDLPAGRPTATTGTIAAKPRSSVDRRDSPRAAKTAPAASATPSTASKETTQYVGALDVDSEPAGGVVFVDGRQVGETPLQLTELRAGSHVVRIERPGHERWTTAVLVAADKQTRVSAKLQALTVR